MRFVKVLRCSRFRRSGKIPGVVRRPSNSGNKYDGKKKKKKKNGRRSMARLRVMCFFGEHQAVDGMSVGVSYDGVLLGVLCA